MPTPRFSQGFSQGLVMEIFINRLGISICMMRRIVADLATQGYQIVNHTDKTQKNPTYLALLYENHVQYFHVAYFLKILHS